MRRAVAAAGWVVLAAGCEQPRTELVARVDSEVAWGAGRTVQSITLTVRRGGPTGPLRSARTTALGMGGERRPLPLLVGIVPTDDTDTPVWIEALGCRDPNGCTATTAAVAQRAVVRFAVGQTQEVPLLLASACVGVTCGSDERCGSAGRCEPATRAQTMVVPFSGTDAATAMDAIVDRIDAATPDRPVAMDSPMGADVRGDVAEMADRIAPIDRGTLLDASVDMAISDVATDSGTIDTPPPCGTSELNCGGRCTAVLSDPMNCGACGTVCANPSTGAAMCASGICRIDCPSNRGDCDGNTANGCETRLLVDQNHCGRCGQHCDSNICAAGSCAPDATPPVGMTLVPGGTFAMGNGMPDVRRVQLSSFYMDTTEVTVSAYALCPMSTCRRPTAGNWIGVGRGSHPINLVDWNQARAYCQWRGGDLPTEAQWEYAGRGTDGRLFPWGNTIPQLTDTPQRLCWNRTSTEGTCEVRSYPIDTSAAGISDLAGNVLEWVLDHESAFPPSSTDSELDPINPAVGTNLGIRGGRWDDSSGLGLELYQRRGSPAGNIDTIIGFRCARRAP